MSENQHSREYREGRASSRQRATQDEMQHPYTPSSSGQDQRARNHSHFLKQGFGCLLTFCVAAIGFFVGTSVGVLLVYVFLQVFSAAALMSEYGVIGILLGLFCLFAANPALRRLCQRLKRRHLRRHGIAVEATVAHQESKILSSPKGPSGDQFELTLRWQYPESGQTCEYVRTYTYLYGLSRKKKDQFLDDYRSGAHLPVLFSPKRPWYFVLDIPFVPAWFDVLF